VKASTRKWWLLESLGFMSRTLNMKTFQTVSNTSLYSCWFRK